MTALPIILALSPLILAAAVAVGWALRSVLDAPSHGAALARQGHALRAAKRAAVHDALRREVGA